MTDRIPVEFSRLQSVTLSDWDGELRHRELDRVIGYFSELVRPTGFLEPPDFVESIGQRISSTCS